MGKLEFRDTKITPQSEGKVLVETVMSDHPDEAQAKIWLRLRLPIERRDEQSLWRIQKDALTEAIVEFNTIATRSKA